MKAKLQNVEVAENGYILTFSAGDIHAVVVGCDGTGESDQYANAAAVKDKVDAGEASFVIHLGDAVYSWNGDGASTYSQIEHQIIKPHQDSAVPFFMVKGNHEEFIHKNPLSAGNQSGIAAYRKLHSFFRGENYVDSAILFHQESSHTSPKLSENFSHNNKFNAGPKAGKSYFSIVCQTQDQPTSEVDYLVIDSNTFPYDQEQKQWLCERISQSTAKHIVIACHHPFKTFDKRCFSRHDSRKYLKRMLIDSSDDQEKRLIDKYEFYRLAYGMSQNTILSGCFRDEIVANESIKNNVNKLRGFLVAHNHSQGVVAGNKAWENIFIQGAGGAKIVPPKHISADYSGKMHYNNEHDTGFGIAVVSDKRFSVASYTLIKDEGSKSRKFSESTIDDNRELTTCFFDHDGEPIQSDKKLTRRSKNLVKEPSQENTINQVSITRRKIIGLDKLLREFCFANKENETITKKYLKLAKYTRFLHNRLGLELVNQIKNKPDDDFIQELGDLAQDAAAILILLTSDQDNKSKMKEKFNRYFDDNFFDSRKDINFSQLLVRKYWHHSPILRNLFVVVVFFAMLAVMVALLVSPKFSALVGLSLLPVNAANTIITSIFSLSMVSSMITLNSVHKSLPCAQFRVFHEAEYLQLSKQGNFFSGINL